MVPRPPAVRPPIILAPPTVTTVPTDAFGAIAYRRATGAFGYAYDFSAGREAGIAALNACADPECVVVATFKNTCAVLVDGPPGPTVAEGATAQEAEVKARQRCTDPGCQVVAWACTRI